MRTNKIILNKGDKIYIKNKNGISEEKIIDFTKEGIITERGYLPIESFREVWFLTKIGAENSEEK